MNIDASFKFWSLKVVIVCAVELRTDISCSRVELRILIASHGTAGNNLLKIVTLMIGIALRNTQM